MGAENASVDGTQQEGGSLDHSSSRDQQDGCVHPLASSYSGPREYWCAAREHRMWAEVKVILMITYLSIYTIIIQRKQTYLSRSGGMKSFNLSFLLISSSRR